MEIIGIKLGFKAEIQQLISDLREFYHYFSGIFLLKMIIIVRNRFFNGQMKMIFL